MIPVRVMEQARQIRLLILDVDGVLTDGKLFFDGLGNEFKAFHAQDGHGIKMLQQTGIEIAVISGRESSIVSKRMEELDVTLVYQGQKNKRAAFQELLQKLNLKPEQVAYVGDDVVDLPIMTQVGLAIAVANANEAVTACADWSTKLGGGLGAVREVCDMIMQSQDNYELILADYLE
ncbi:MAG: 3-deoxy-manno-octulosonate-8-phosphatase KdsC [Methylococcales bacterium]|nr:3-deoxy-manno-octulosonate-8-phosphatase KdsC [Methylococcales bacterium]MDD5754862.1 3-deoxy-manno-octulosonate-8-phosphatase KdsC [Methylococcales bacterium]